MPASVIARARAAVIALAASALVLIAVLPAQATVIKDDSFSDSFVGVSELCGFQVHEAGEFSVDGQLRVGKGASEGLFFSRARIRFAFTITNLENGRFFTTVGDSRFTDLKAVPVGGGVFKVTSIETGKTFTLRDSSGRAVLRDRGQVRTTILFDTFGDAMPGGEVLAELDVRFSGRHPGVRFDDEGRFCSVVTELLG
jgi:hypothetical protein